MRKKSFFVSLFLLLAMFVPLLAAQADDATSTDPGASGPVIVATSTADGAPIPMLISANPPATSTASLPDFEITNVMASSTPASDGSSDSSTLSYYATVINHGADFPLSADNALGLSVRNDASDNSANNASYYAVGTAGTTFTSGQKITVGPLLAATDGAHVITLVINPLLTIAEGRYNNNFFQKKVYVGVTAPSVGGSIVPPLATSTEPHSTSTPPHSTSTPPVKFNLAKEASLVAVSGSSADKLSALIQDLKIVKNAKAMTDNMNKFVASLQKQFPKEPTAKFYTVNNFVTYGTASTVKLSASNRFNLVTAFVKTNKRLPSSQSDWNSILASKK